ncbi:hypothetical protein J1N35_015090 [Gossypium stocksii]|uniref:RNase H type-1 domain-containing protein n=1 Tax=Gossypium stocksii TaxID=47602 RepID=A0A9D3VXM3_9ROSI|nr:hypothetical protein J1N35_015090 [Gossypium stocksii]
MGFRDLHKFNIALLAEQGWNLLMNPTSLLAQVTTHEVIFYVQGCVLTPRIPGKVSRMPVIYWTKDWDGRILFDEETVKQILMIPLVCQSQTDVLVWRGDKSEVNKVKSSYRWLITDRLHNTEDNTAFQNTRMKSSFTKMWNLKVANKIRTYMWKLTKGFLPTLYNLKNKGLVRNVCCPVSKEDEESVIYLTRDCKFTRNILQELGVEDSTTDRNQNWQNWLVDFLFKNDIIKCKILVVSFWALWFNRNRVYHEGLKPKEQEVISFIKAYMVENELLEGSLAPKTVPKIVKWEPPNRDMVKINFDASFQQDLNTSKAGIIARNKDGLIMVACIYPSTNISTPETAEAWACLHVVTFGEELGFREICVEGDTLMVDKGVTTTAEYKSCISNVIKAVTRKCANFTKMKFRFVP